VTGGDHRARRLGASVTAAAWDGRRLDFPSGERGFSGVRAMLHHCPMADVTTDEIDDPRRWKKDGWIARVIKNEGDDG